MSMIINNNISAINTKRNFATSANGMAAAMARLSSGLRINTGKDDPSGLGISEQLRSQKTGLERAKQNTAEAMNVMSIAEGAMNEMNNILKKMKALAIHASNDGITSPDQIAADQAELDSAIQTIDRIAQTTKFAGENLLNGNKDIDYTRKTAVKATQNNGLLNTRDSYFSQIFKRDGYSVSLTYNGADAVRGTVDACGIGTRANLSAQASKAYFEVDVQSATHGSDLTNNAFLHEQQFTVTGNRGSRQVTVGKGQTIGQLVRSIRNGADATGVTASLIFNSDQLLCKAQSNATQLGITAARDPHRAHVFNNALNDAGTGLAETSISNVNISGMQGRPGAGAGGMGSGAIQFGYNTDGQGNIYIKYTGDNSAELYKDASMSRESLVGVANRATGTHQFNVVGSNFSGLTGMVFTLQGPNSTNLTGIKGTYINFGGIESSCNNVVGLPTNAGVEMSGALFEPGGSAAGVPGIDSDAVFLAGIQLGRNTSDEGEIFLKTVQYADGTVQISAYRDAKMEQKDLVAQSGRVVNTAVQVTLNEMRNDDETAGTGLGIVLNNNTRPIAPGATDAEYTSTISFANLGARIYAEGYGEDQYCKITQDKGQSISYFGELGNTDTRTLITAGETARQNGQNAILSVNGRQVKTDGLRLRVATQDIQADFTFNAGSVGSTTLAQVGYGEGSPFTKAGVLNLGDNIDGRIASVYENLSAYLCNAGHATSEKLDDFQGGMQLQLGEGAGSQNRTVAGIRSMTSENLGRVTKTVSEDIPPVYVEKTFTMKDMLSGGGASLSADASLAMEIIEKSIGDVAGMRATIGAIQSNLLQTNENNLSVAIENVTKTESGIRDADMADEMTEFTKQQVLQNAAMSMLTQANAASQNVLQLLR